MSNVLNYLLDYKMDVDMNFQISDQDNSNGSKKGKQSFWIRMIELLSHLVAELMSPPAIATVSSLYFLLFAFLSPALLYLFLGLVSSFYYFNAI